MRELLKKIDYPIPAHALRLGYTLGGLSAFSFFLMLITGVLLSFQYVPAFTEVRASLLHIEESSFLQLLHSLHAWASEAFLVLILLHVTRIVLTKAASGRRKVNWYVGIGLLLLASGSFFTGTVLKWDQEGYEALAHQMAVFTMVPGGDYLLKFFEGKYILMRIFSLHAILFPLLILLILAWHIMLVKVLGISPCVPGRSCRATHSFGQHLRRLLGWGLSLTGVLFFLAVSFPPPHFQAPWSGVEWTKPPWLFYGLYALENLFGIKALLWAPPLFLGGLAALPLLSKEKKQADFGTWLFVVGVLFFLGMSAYVALTPPAQHF